MRLLVRIVIIIVLVCTVSCRDRKGVQSVNEQMEQVKSDTKLTFPSNARLEHFLEPERFIYPVWVAKVIIPASSYESFKQDLVSRPDDKTRRHESLADSTNWWKPTKPVLSKQYVDDSDGYALIQIVVSKEDEEFAVYIECVVF